MLSYVLPTTFRIRRLIMLRRDASALRPGAPTLHAAFAAVTQGIRSAPRCAAPDRPCRTYGNPRWCKSSSRLSTPRRWARLRTEDFAARRVFS